MSHNVYKHGIYTRTPHVISQIFQAVIIFANTKTHLMATYGKVTTSRSSETKALIEQGYDTVAPAYLAWSGPRPTTTRTDYLNKLFALLSPGAKILELGCGAGVPATQVIIEKGFDVTGVDISAAQIELARQHVPQATLIHDDMMSLEFEPGSFDAVIAFYSIFHLPKEEQGLMVERIISWLKGGGYLLFNLHSEEGDILRDDWMGVKMFSSGLGVDGTRQMLKKDGKGLKIIEDKIDVERVGRMEERFHWIFATKKEEGQEGQ